MTKMQDLAQLGQAIWLDYIRRSFIESGELREWVDKGLRGVTSNPSIFEKAITGSTDYDEALRGLVEAGRSVTDIYETLAVADIQSAADVLRPVYDQTGGLDGFVSLEVSPDLADDTGGTIAEARRLHAAVDRPNLLIKVPATPAGVPAIEQLISEGISVNVTLIFSLDHYRAVAEAYIAGLERRLAAGEGEDISRVASVASFFVSRVDAAVDRELQALGDTSLQGKIAVANAKMAYATFHEIFSGSRWEALALAGARMQRVLWASTSTKNPAYKDTLYVDELVGADTVNTVPPHTLDAFLDHGMIAATLEQDLDQARVDLARLVELGVDLDQVTDKLQRDGVEAFAKAFQGMIDGIAAKRQELASGWQNAEVVLGEYGGLVDAAVKRMAEQAIVGRIWTHDHTVWKDDPTEITNRLGWLHIAENMVENLPAMEEILFQVRRDGYTNVLLLGMGGSSLAPEVFAKTFGGSAGSLELTVLDSTDPAAVLAEAEGLDPARTLFIVSTKSGGTTETLSFFKFFYNWVQYKLEAGKAGTGAHFVAITDPGSKLADLAAEYSFRATFLNDPNIGGRYSALSYFGLVPATLAGADVPLLLHRATMSVCGSQPCVMNDDNLAVRLGATIAELSMVGRDKLTLVISSEIASFGDWVEQLVAESLGKEGNGVLPVEGEPLGGVEAYGPDRLFVQLRLADDLSADSALQALQDAGHPVVRLHLRDRYDLGGQFFLWEMATAIAGHLLGINPFDQPDVEAAKKAAREAVDAYVASGALPEQIPALEADGIVVYGDVVASGLGEALDAFLAQAETKSNPRGYVAIQAYVQPTAEAGEALLKLRMRLREKTGLATTVGYGPRFLHSTGQLYKGDAGNGLFIQLTSEAKLDAPIPDEAGKAKSAMTFGVLKAAQALGDQWALSAGNRRFIRFHLGTDVVRGVRRLTKALG